MGLKVFLLAFLAVYSLQGINASSEYELEASDRGIEDQLKELLEKLREAVKDAVEEALKVAKDLYDKLSGVAKEEVDAALKALKEIVDSTLAEIEKLKEQAAELGEAAIACAEAQRPEAEALAEETRQALAKIHENFTIEIEALIVTIYKPLRAVVDTVNKLVTEFQNCKNLVCKVGVITKVYQVVEKVNQAKEEVKQRVQDFIIHTLPATKKQVEKVIANHREKDAVLVGKVKECMDNIGN